MADWRTWAQRRGQTVFDRYDERTGATVSYVNDAATNRYFKTQESIDLALKNQGIDRENRENALIAAVRRAKVIAEARKKEARVEAGIASANASRAASNTSRLLVEFEAERSQRRALSTRQGDQAVGLVTAGFQASGVSSVGASQEAVRQSNLEKLIFESQSNQRKEGILREGRNAIQGALNTAARSAASIESANAGVKAASISAPYKDRAISTLNPYTPTTLWQKSGSLPFVDKGY